MIPDAVLYPFRVLFSGYFNDDQLTSFLTGALTVGLIWLLTVLQACVPDKFTRDWTESFDTEDDDNDDGLNFVDPWNAPFTYVSNQQRRMMRSSFSTMADIQKHIGELPQHWKRKHWPWETIRRKVLGEESDNDDDGDDLSSTSLRADGSIASATAGEEKKEEDFAFSRGDASDVYDAENEKNSPTSPKSQGSDTCTNKDEKQLCIGSIFGLDVGGTLAKLVYFEKKALDNDQLQIRSMREKHYVQAVSAQTVLMARLQSKRSMSMSPMRKCSISMIREGNRARSSTGDLEFNEDEKVVRRNLIPPSNKVTDRMPDGSTVALDHTRQSQTKKCQAILRENESDSNGGKRQQQQQLEDEEPPTIPQRESSKSKSSEDLKELFAIRQESLPDDIEQFQHSVGFLPPASSIDKARKLEDSNENRIIIDDDDDENDSLSNPPESSLDSNLLTKRSLSMMDLSAQHDRQKAEALNRFYDFARRLDTHEDSISDIQLSFYCRELGGEFHFAMLPFIMRSCDSLLARQ